MKISLSPRLFALAVTALFAAHANAADLSAGDKMFVLKAAQGGMTEVKLGEIAAEKGGTSAVKTYGQMLVADHTKADEKLATLGRKEGFMVPAELDKKHRAMVDEMSEMSGEAFDKAYVPATVKAHKTTIALFEKEAKEGENAELKTFAEKTLPTLKMHLVKIEAIEKSMR